jgi:hypothetical protein
MHFFVVCMTLLVLSVVLAATQRLYRELQQQKRTSYLMAGCLWRVVEEKRELQIRLNKIAETIDIESPQPG